MPDLALLDCLQPELVKLKRVKYFQRQLLTADDMVTDQDYFRQKLRRHNRFLHGWGVVCGLEVIADPEAAAPWRVRIDPGYALGPQGDEIFVASGVHMDLAQCGPGAATDPCDPSVLRPGGSSQGSDIFLVIRYAECVANPVRALPSGCGCEDEVCEYSRLCDSFQIECLEELPPSHQPNPDATSLCDILSGGQIVPCLPCHSEPWVVLARIALPASPSAEITDSQIDNSGVRRQIFSTAVIQEQLIECCCNGEPREGADLMITQTATVEPLDDGFNMVRVLFSTRIENLGPQTSAGITFTDGITATPGLIADGDFSAPITPAGNWTSNPLPLPVPRSPAIDLEAELPQLAFGEIAEIDFSLDVRRGNATSLTSSFAVSSATPDPDLTNNSGVITVPLIQSLPDLAPLPNPDSTLTGPQSFCNRGPIGLIVLVRNQGSGNAPASVTRVAFQSGPTVNVQTPPIVAGAQVQLPEIPFPPGGGADDFFTITVNANNDFPEASSDNNSADGVCIG